MNLKSKLILYFQRLKQVSMVEIKFKEIKSFESKKRILNKISRRRNAEIFSLNSVIFRICLLVQIRVWVSCHR